MTGNDDRRELDQLAGWLTRLENRVETIDRSGTRSMGAVLVQISDLSKDMGDLAGAQRTWQRTHDDIHRSEQTQRASSRRWLITLALGNAVALLGPWLVVLAHHLRANYAPGPSTRPVTLERSSARWA